MRWVCRTHQAKLPFVSQQKSQILPWKCERQAHEEPCLVAFSKYCSNNSILDCQGNSVYSIHRTIFPQTGLFPFASAQLHAKMRKKWAPGSTRIKETQLTRKYARGG
jgi:hypothetical protein